MAHRAAHEVMPWAHAGPSKKGEIARKFLPASACKARLWTRNGATGATCCEEVELEGAGIGPGPSKSARS